MGARGVGGEPDRSHRDVPAATDPFDLRPAHQLEPAVRILTVTEPLRAMLGQGLTTAKVTVVPTPKAAAPTKCSRSRRSAW